MRWRVKLFTAILILGFLMAASSFAGNTGIPELPAQYYGKVISPTPLNGYIEAKIEDKTYANISLVNNTFGGPTYLDSKLLVYAPGQEGKEVKFYLNGSVLLNTSEFIRYNPGDVRYIELYYNVNITKLEILKKFVILEDKENIVKIENNIVLIKLPVKKVRDVLIIPVIINETSKIEINESVIEKLNKTLEVAEEIKKVEIRDETDVKEVVEDIVENITPVIAVNFNITNKAAEEPKKIGNKVISNISFEAINTSKKGFVTVLVPIGKLRVEKITVSNGTTTETLKEWNESNIDIKTGWYKIIGGEILEVTLIKDPKVKITLNRPRSRTFTYQQDSCRGYQVREDKGVCT